MKVDTQLPPPKAPGRPDSSKTGHPVEAGTVEWLNYNHLYYFWVIAREGGVTAASRKLRLSQSTLSAQLRLLEEALGHELFEREKRALKLTEHGRRALDYADTIFETGQELFASFRGAAQQEERRQVIRIGALGSLSKNLQYEFIRPALQNKQLHLTVVEGSLDDLTHRLRDHELDVAISNMPVRTDLSPDLHNRSLGSLPMCLVGTPAYKKLRGGLETLPEGLPMLLPTYQSKVRSELDLALEQAGAKPDVRAEIEDMALMRICALSGEGVAVAPEIVVRNELREKTLVVLHRLKSITETFYAITPSRRSRNAVVEELIERFQAQVSSGKL